MDAAQRERLRTQTQLISQLRKNPWLARGVVWMIVSLPTIIIIAWFAVTDEFRQVSASWPWRHAVACDAIVRQHRVQRTWTWPNFHPYDHIIEYTYDADGKAVSGGFQIASASEEVIELHGLKYKLPVGAKFPVFYRPDTPATHAAFVDPRLPLRGGILRLLAVGSFAGTLMAIVIYFAFFHRRRHRVPTDAKLVMPQELIT